MVVTLDNAVGEVVAALRRQGMFENTLVIFHSDVTLPQPTKTQTVTVCACACVFLCVCARGAL